MSAEMWRFAALLLFFVLVLIASYWFVLLPDRWTIRRGRRDGVTSGEASRSRKISDGQG